MSGVHLQRQGWRDALRSADLWDTVSQKVEEMRREQRELKESSTTEYTYDFGKHRGKTLRQVEAEDPRYAAWCIVSGVHLRRQGWRDALLAADL